MRMESKGYIVQETETELQLKASAEQFAQVWTEILNELKIPFAVPTFVIDNKAKTIAKRLPLGNKIVANTKIIEALAGVSPQSRNAFMHLVTAHETAHSVAEQLGARSFLRVMTHLSLSSIRRYERSCENCTEFLTGASLQHLRKQAPQTVTLETIGLMRERLQRMGSTETTPAHKREYGLGKERVQWFDKGFSDPNIVASLERIKGMSKKAFMEEFGKTE